MSLAFIIGVAVISAVFLTIAFKLDQEHGLLRFAFILFAMGLMFLIPASLVHDSTVCEQLLDTTTVSGNITTYDYVLTCHDINNGSLAFVKAVKYPYWLFIAYLVVYLFYKAALALGNASKDGKLSRFFKGWK